MLKKTVYAIKLYYSLKEREVRWTKTRAGGFYRFLVINSLIILPLGALFCEMVAFNIFYHRSPFFVEFVAGYIGALFYSIPWAIMTWRQNNKTFSF